MHLLLIVGVTTTPILHDILLIVLSAVFGDELMAQTDAETSAKFSALAFYEL